MGTKINLSGVRFGRLTAIEPTIQRNKQGSIVWKCSCDCGHVVYVASHDLTKGNNRSCGCSRNDERPNRRKYNDNETGTRLYRIWANIKTRCTNPHDEYKYSRYGGRGIKICSEWSNSFTSFKKWALANGYDEELTIDRIDNDGDYTPENCRWTTQSQQAYNRHKKGEIA